VADTPPRGSRIPGARTTLTGTGRAGTTTPMPTVSATPAPPAPSESDGWNLEDEEIEGGATSPESRRRFGPLDESGLRTAVNASPTNRMPVVRQRVSTPGAGTPTTGPDVHTSTTLRDLPPVPVQPSALFGAVTTEPARVRDVPMPEPAASARKTTVDQPMPAAVAALVSATSSATAAATAPQSDPKRGPTTKILDRIVATPSLASSGSISSREPSGLPVEATSVGAPPKAPSAQPEDEIASGPRVEVARHVLTGELDPRLVLLTETDSPRAASFRVLRHRLVENGNPRLIAVSSPDRGDGKTTAAANLALALAERGRARVLLVEANLRTPDLATVFGFLPPVCFARQLAAHRERPLDPWTVVDVGDTGLHVAAIHPETARGALVDGVALGVALAALPRAGYDYVVIDTPSVLGAADVNLVADYAHGVLLVSRSGKTTARALRRAVEQVAPSHLLGLMLLDA
jgi:Mrp family chromosome partitioning ATPase